MVTWEQLEELDLFGSPAAQAREVERMLAWAEQVGPGSEVGRAELLIHAAETVERSGDINRAVQLFQAAAEDGGSTVVDGRSWLVSALLDAGRAEEAAPWIDELRHADDLTSETLLHLGETLEHAGRFLEGLEVFQRSLTTEPGPASLGLLNGRRRCREALGLPFDEVDASTEALRSSFQALLEERGGLDQDELFLEPFGGAAREVDLFGFVPHALWAELSARLPLEDASWEAQRRRIELALRTDPSGLPVGLVSLASLEQYAEVHGLDPQHGSTFDRFLRAADREGLSTPWPPGRNDPCWCGAGAKYKKCCGRAAGPL